MRRRRRHITTLRSTRKHEIYFVLAPTARRMKIGITDRVTTRVAQLRAASPVEVTLVHAIKGTARQERALHLYFALERTHGEWFNASERLLAFVESLRGLDEKRIAAFLRSLRTPARSLAVATEPRYRARRARERRQLTLEVA